MLVNPEAADSLVSILDDVYKASRADRLRDLIESCIRPVYSCAKRDKSRRISTLQIISVSRS
jgi:hypothetical protein